MVEGGGCSVTTGGGWGMEAAGISISTAGGCSSRMGTTGSATLVERRGVASSSAAEEEEESAPVAASRTPAPAVAAFSSTWCHVCTHEKKEDREMNKREYM